MGLMAYPADIVSRWSIWFPGCPPFRPDMRWAHHARWLRVYSLPDGKRYAENDEERSELLRRHAAVSTSLLGEGTPCAVVIAYRNGYRGEHDPPSVRRLGAIEVAGWEREWAEDPDFADDLEGAMFAAASCVCRRGSFDDVILDVAEDRTPPLFLVALETGRVYSPYDGGADLFVDSEEARDALRGEFSEWTSGREDGL